LVRLLDPSTKAVPIKGLKLRDACSKPGPDLLLIALDPLNQPLRGLKAIPFRTDEGVAV